MSYDLEIALHDQAKFEHIRELLSELKEYEATGSLEGDKGNALVDRIRKGKRLAAFTVDGPFPIEAEDIPETLGSSVLDPRWLVQIRVPASASAKDRKAAVSLARHLGDRCRGAVYDPQEDRVIYPQGGGKRYSAPSKEERIRIVQCEWFLPPDRYPAGTAETALKVLRWACPEALPRRFGTYEPLKSRMEPGNPDSFLSEWEECARIDFGSTLFWKATSPCFGGHVQFPDWRNKFKPPGTVRAIHLSMTFDGRALHGDARWAETVVSLFTHLSRQLGAFFAAGHVARNVIAKRGLWFDGESESAALHPGRWWIGLPPHPAWLTWFGRPYVALLESRLSESLAYPEGNLLRLGGEPLDTDQLKGLYPRWPDELIFTPKPQRLGHPEGVPAALIPEVPDITRSASDLRTIEVKERHERSPGG